MTPIQSPAGSDGTISPQCVPLTTSYSTINITNAENVQPERILTKNLSADRGTITFSLQYDPSSAALQVNFREAGRES